MRRVFALGAVFIALTGCAAPRTSHGWHPENEREMKQLIGETTIQALSQFFMQAQQSHQNHLNKQLVQPLNERL